MSSLKIGPQDMGRKRLFENNGIKFEFEARDPYGLIHTRVINSRDQIDGTFLTFKDAEAAATKYSLNVKKKET